MTKNGNLEMKLGYAATSDVLSLIIYPCKNKLAKSSTVYVKDVKNGPSKQRRCIKKASVWKK